MPWSDRPGPTPERSEAELLALVQARAGRIRRRRRVLSASAGVAVVVALVAGVVALAQPGSGGPSSLHVTGPGPSSVPPVAVTETPTSTTEAPTSTSTTPATTVTTVRVTTPATPSTTRVTAAPTTVATTTSTTSTTTVPAPVPCQPSEVLVTATPSKATYAPGETITVTAAAENRSGHPCYPADPRLEFSDATGKGLGGVAVADMFTMGSPGQPPPTWAAGRILSAPFNWQCPGSPGGCPPGAYTVVASFGSFRSAPASFTVGG